VDGIKVVCIAWDGEGKKATGWESRFAARSKRGAFRRLGLGTRRLVGGMRPCVRRLMSNREGAVRMTWDFLGATAAGCRIDRQRILP
jgi:hypothetical protein